MSEYKQISFEDLGLIKESVVKLERSNTPLVTTVSINEYTNLVRDCFDFEFDGVSEYYPYKLPKELPSNFKSLLIVGSSGSGKSVLSREFGTEDDIEWSEDSLVSNFNSPSEASERLSSVGLNSIPQWVKPYKALSNGEKFRADLSRKIHDNSIIDEFTSVVDRDVAKSCSVSISKYIKRENIKGIVFATCHRDVIDFLQPEYVIDTDLGIFYKYKECARQFKVELRKTNWRSWRYFSKHHYLTQSINKASRCYLIFWEDTVIGFTSYLHSPNGYIKRAWREHRTVILPEYQGLGIGSKISELIGEILIGSGDRYYSKTAHVRLGTRREKNEKWRTCSTSMQKRVLTDQNRKNREGRGFDSLDENRICYSHEYVGIEFSTKKHLNVICNSDDVEKLKEVISENVDRFIITHCNIGSECDKYSIENGIRSDIFPLKTNMKRIEKTDYVII